MKKIKGIVFVGVFLFSPIFSWSQLALDKELFDSLISRRIHRQSISSIVYVVKMAYEDKKKKELNFSISPIYLKNDIPVDVIGLYKKSNTVLYIRNTDILIDSALKKEIIYRNSEAYKNITNTLKGDQSKGDMLTLYLDLPVYHIKKMKLSKNYIITWRLYIPYNTAPQKYWPVEKYVYAGFSIDKFDYLKYTDINGSFNSCYKKTIKTKKFKLQHH